MANLMTFAHAISPRSTETGQTSIAELSLLATVWTVTSALSPLHLFRARGQSPLFFFGGGNTGSPESKMLYATE